MPVEPPGAVPQAVWDSLFTVTPEGGGRSTRLDLVVEGRPYRFMSRLFVPLMKGVVAKAVAADMDSVRAWLEGQDQQPVEG